MIIEIRKAGFGNKGAQLMLRAIVQRLRSEFPQCVLAMDPSHERGTYRERALLGLYQKVWVQRLRVNWAGITGLVPVGLRREYGLVLDRELDVVIDAAGFAYGDQWNCAMIENAARCVRRWQKRGTRVVLMPQAFGPFSDPRRRKALRTLIDNSDLVYARDKASYTHIVDVVGERDNVKTAPDLTNLIEGERSPHFDPSVNRFCIIPNYRMIDRTDSMISQRYVDFLALCAQYLSDIGRQPFILIHEGENDLRLGQQVSERLGGAIAIVREEDAVRAKGIIGASEGVISSRFHGIVSALSQGVPALATGWSHKYQMLLEDYGVPEGLMPVTADLDEIRSKIDLITQAVARRDMIATIRHHATLQKQAAEQMWSEVLTLIRS